MLMLLVVLVLRLLWEVACTVGIKECTKEPSSSSKGGIFLLIWHPTTHTPGHHS
jgi:hypothetical protein